MLAPVYAGVPNDLDRNGCIDDSDADGVPDNQDLCPGHDDDVDDDADGIIDGVMITLMTPITMLSSILLIIVQPTPIRIRRIWITMR